MAFRRPGSHCLQTSPLMLCPSRSTHILVSTCASEKGHSTHLAIAWWLQAPGVGVAAKGFYFCTFWNIDAMSGGDAAVL